MLTETPVSCMPKDNHKQLLFKTAGKHIRKKKNESTALEPTSPDKTATKREL